MDEEDAKKLYCPESMASPVGPRFCLGRICLGWRVCPWRRGEVKA